MERRHNLIIYGKDKVIAVSSVGYTLRCLSLIVILTEPTLI